MTAVLHPAGGGNGEDVHVGGGDGVELPRGVLVDGLDVVVDLHQLNVDVVAVCPLFQNSRLFRVVPGGPPHVKDQARRKVGRSSEGPGRA